MTVFCVDLTQAQEPEEDSLQVFIKELCDVEVLRTFALDVFKFNTIAEYKMNGSNEVSIDEFVDKKLQMAKQIMAEEKDSGEVLVLSCCRIPKVDLIDCNTAAEFIEKGQDLKISSEQIIEVMNYLNVQECLKADFAGVEQGADVVDVGFYIAGKENNTWHFMYVEFLEDIVCEDKSANDCCNAIDMSPTKTESDSGE